jgi:hypothetical protein
LLEILIIKKKAGYKLPPLMSLSNAALPRMAASLPPAAAAEGFLLSSTGVGELILTGSLEGMGLEVNPP